jgi:hypothetical protein
MRRVSQTFVLAIFTEAIIHLVIQCPPYLHLHKMHLPEYDYYSFRELLYVDKMSVCDHQDEKFFYFDRLGRE